MPRLLAFTCFIFGLCLTLLAGWHWSQVTDETQVAWIIFGNLSPSEENAGIYRMRFDGLYVQRFPEPHNVTPMLLNGEWIYFQNDDIYRIRVDGSDIQNITRTLAGEARGLQISPDNQWIYFTLSRYTQHSIYRMHLDGTNVEKITHQSPNYVLTFTPDHQWVIFLSYDDELYGINKIHGDGSGLQNLSPLTNRDASLALVSLDSQWVFFGTQQLVSESTYRTDIYRVNINGSQLENLTASLDSPYNTPLIATDDWIFFHGGFQIYRMHLDGSQIQNLTPFTGGGSSLEITPNQEWIVFVSDQTGSNPQIYRMRLDGSQLQNLSPTFSEAFSPEITPDGEWIIFTSRVNSFSTIYRMHIDGTEKSQIIAMSGTNWVIGFVPLPTMPFHREVGIVLGTALMVGASVLTISRRRNKQRDA